MHSNRGTAKNCCGCGRTDFPANEMQTAQRKFLWYFSRQESALKSDLEKTIDLLRTKKEGVLYSSGFDCFDARKNHNVQRYAVPGNVAHHGNFSSRCRGQTGGQKLTRRNFITPQNAATSQLQIFFLMQVRAQW